MAVGDLASEAVWAGVTGRIVVAVLVPAVSGRIADVEAETVAVGLALGIGGILPAP